MNSFSDGFCRPTALRPAWGEELNDAQRAAVEHMEGPLLVIAGAGSGKTRTLTHRVARLVAAGIPPAAILLLTFTRKASREMLQRAARLLDHRCERVSGGTFHSFANLKLRQYAANLGLSPDFAILDRTDAEDLIGLIRKEADGSSAGHRLPRKNTLADIFSLVSLREYWQDEARDYTNWLSQEENLGLLSDTLGMDLELEGVEVAVGPYKADVIARDVTSDTRVVIENQLEKTNHDHLGKILTYASGLDAPIMIWIAREFSEEHRRALDFINEKASPELQCYGIEIQLWRIGNSLPAPQFKVISSPNEYTSEIKADTGSNELTETKALYLDLWNGFKDYCGQKDTILKIRKPRPQHWLSISVGRSKFQISLTASLQNRRVGCEIYMRGRNAKTAFKLLGSKKKTPLKLSAWWLC